MATHAATTGGDLAAVSARGPRLRVPDFRRLRRHWVFLLLAAGGVVLRVLVSYAYWPALELNGDSYSYLRGVTYTGVGHPAAYPVLLRWLAHSGSLGSVTVVQHVLGLGVALAGYALLLRVGVRPWLAALSTAPVLLDAYQLDVEHFILADILTQAALMLGLVLVLWPRDDRTRTAAVFGVSAGLCAAVAMLSRFAIAPTLAVAAAYLLVRWRWRTLLAFGLTVGLALGAYAAWNLHGTGRSGLTAGGGPPWLYARVAPIATCDYPMPADVRSLCPPGAPATRPGPEYYDWSLRSPLHTTGRGPRLLARADRFAKTVIRHQPLDYAALVLADTGRYFLPGRDDNPRNFLLARYQFPLATDDPPPLLHIAIANRTFDNKAITSHAHEGMARSLRRYQDVGYTQGPLLLAGLLGGLGCGVSLIGASRRRDARWAALVLAAVAVGVLLEPSLLVGFSYRYVLPALATLPAAAAVACDLLIDRFARRRRPRG